MINSSRNEDLSQYDYKYDYPDDLNLKPTEELHDDIVRKVLQRAKDSKRSIQPKYAKWREIDKTLTAYINLDESEAALKEQDSRAPVSIVVPSTYAVLDTMLTYMIDAFFKTPVFSYVGVDSGDVVGAALLEMLIENNVHKFKMLLNMHTMFRDALAYGIGVMAVGWKAVLGKRPYRIAGTTVNVPEVLYEGSCLDNIDPYSFFPDPNVPSHDLDKAEYVGWLRRTSLPSLMRDELTSGAGAGATVFNTKYLKHIDGKSALRGDQVLSDDPVSYASNDDRTSHPIDVVFMCVDIIPKDWKLGDSTEPEKWMFAVGGDMVLIMAEPLIFSHNKFPIVVCAPEFDGYSVCPVSKIEVCYGLQEVINFMYNSHIANVRKLINNVLLVDPERVNIFDIDDSRYGGIVRLRPEAFGSGVENAVKQINLQDVTGGHMADVSSAFELLQRTTSAGDVVSGNIKGGERRSAMEMRGVIAGATARLNKAARVVSTQVMYDLGYMLAYNVQQFMSQDAVVRISGKYKDTLVEVFGSADRAPVSLSDISIDFDIVPFSGAEKSNEMLDIWANLFQTIGSQPMLLQQFDIVRIFSYIAQLLGAKNVHDFKIKTQPTEMVQGAAQAGSAIPMEQLQQMLPAGAGGM